MMRRCDELRSAGMGAVLSLLAVMSVGCGGGESGPALHHVTGDVTFDGAPVETGRIEFWKPDGKAFGGDIKNGTYAVDSESGSMKVKITASRIVPGKFDKSNPDDPPQPVGEMYVPEKYNARTELTADVKEGSNSIPFTLTK